MALGNKGPTFFCFVLFFQNVISSLLLVQMEVLKTLSYVKISKKNQILPLPNFLSLEATIVLA